MTSMPRLLLSFFLVLLAASQLHAATRTVCPSGCDYQTIGAAVAASQAADVIHVTGNHTYTEPTYSVISFPISFLAVGGGTVRVSATNAVGFLELLSVVGLTGSWSFAAASDNMKVISLNEPGSLDSNGELSFAMSGASQVGMSVANCSWTHSGNLSFTLANQGHAMVADSAALIYTDGAFDISSPGAQSTAISLSGDNTRWTQDGELTIALSGSDSTGVLVGSGATWLQRGSLDFSVSGGEGTSMVEVKGGKWNQAHQVSGVVTDSTSGVLLSHESGTLWTQSAAISANISGGSALSFSCGVSFSDDTIDSSLWQKNGPTPVLTTSGLFAHAVCPPPPSPTPSSTPSNSPTPSFTPSATPSNSPTPSSTPSNSPSASATPSNSPSASPSPSPSPSSGMSAASSATNWLATARTLLL